MRTVEIFHAKVKCDVPAKPERLHAFVIDVVERYIPRAKRLLQPGETDKTLLTRVEKKEKHKTERTGLD